MTNFKITVFFILFASSMANASEHKVIKVSKSKNRVIIVKGGVEPGANVVFKDSFSETCFGDIKEVKKNQAIVDISNCPNKENIKVGSVFKLVKLKEESANLEKDNKTKKTPTINEDWYTLWGFGFSNIRYGDDELNDAFDDADKADGVDRSSFSMDLFGFYWPLADKKSMHGFVLSSVSDSVDGPGGEVTVSQSLYAYSYHKFYGQNIGDGWFIRGDLGLAVFHVEADTTSYNFSESSDFGLGFLAGGGHAFAIGSETRLLVGLYLTHRKAESESITSTNINVGFLF